MDVDGFWQIVERARATAGPAADRAQRDGQPSPVTEALVAELTRLPLREIVEFDFVFDEVRAEADSWDVCAACWIIEYGFLSDDGFSDFCAGLAGMGRSTFEAAIADPDSLAGHPAVQEISTSPDHSLWIGDEELLYAANRAYERLTGDSEAFWEATEALERSVAPATGSAEPERGRWDLVDEGEWQRRLPKLGAMFLAQRMPVT